VQRSIQLPLLPHKLEGFVSPFCAPGFGLLNHNGLRTAKTRLYTHHKRLCRAIVDSTNLERVLIKLNAVSQRRIFRAGSQ
jgi:hypothetical protein